MDCELIIERRRHGCTVLTCAGPLDLAGRERIVAAVDRVLLDGPRAVVLDFSSTTFIDCGSMRLLDQLRRSLPAGTGWTVVCPPGAIRHTLDLGGFAALGAPWVATLRTALVSERVGPGDDDRRARSAP